MRVKSQYLFVIVAVGVVALYFVVRSIFSSGEPSAARAKPAARRVSQV